jgi:hypothetical protein
LLEALITSKTRIKLLLKFFLNSAKQDYLRNLENEFGDNNNGIRQELNKMEAAGLLNASLVGNKKIFRSNTRHPLFSDLQSMIYKMTGLDEIIKRVFKNLGELQMVYLTGDLAQGRDAEIVDLVLVGNINNDYVQQLTRKTESYISRKIRFVVFTAEEFKNKKSKVLKENDLLLWKK